MSWYPLIEEGQWSYKYAFLRASGAMLLRFGASLKRVNGAIMLENALVPHVLYYLGQQVDFDWYIIRQHFALRRYAVK